MNLQTIPIAMTRKTPGLPVAIMRFVVTMTRDEGGVERAYLDKINPGISQDISLEQRLAFYKSLKEPMTVAEPTKENIDKTIAKLEFAADVASWRVITESDVPADRQFRGAWVDQDGAIAHDMDRAKEIRRSQLRGDRVPILDDLDVAYTKADEKGDSAEKKRIAAERQRLRDIPADPRIDAAMTIEELKAITV